MEINSVETGRNVFRKRIAYGVIFAGFLLHIYGYVYRAGRASGGRLIGGFDRHYALVVATSGFLVLLGLTLYSFEKAREWRNRPEKQKRIRHAYLLIALGYCATAVAFLMVFTLF